MDAVINYSPCKYLLVKILAVQTILIVGLIFFGPYEYKVASIDGIVYYVFNYVLLLFGLILGSYLSIKCPRSSCVVNQPVSLKNRVAIKVCTTLSLVAVVAGVVFASEVIGKFGLSSLIEGADNRVGFSMIRSNISKIAEALTFVGPACYVVANWIGYANRAQAAITLCALFSPGLDSLLLGARWRLTVCILIYLFGKCRNMSVKKKYILDNIKNIRVTYLLLILLAAAIGIFFLTVVIRLFSERGVYDASSLRLFSYGDMSLRPWARKALESMPQLDALFKASNYITQAPFVFSEVYTNPVLLSPHWGLYTFRIVGQVIETFGFPVNGLIELDETIFSGFYTGFVYGLVADFGVYLAPIAAFLIGYVFGRIEKSRSMSALSGMLFPLVCTMVTLSPFYYFFIVGQMDYILVCFFVIYSMVHGSRNRNGTKKYVDKIQIRFVN